MQDAAAKALLDEFEEFFSEPTQLPLARTLVHKISFIPGSKPVNIKHYEKFYVHKEKIE